MELPLETKGSRKATHDFLSLYPASSAHVQQDPAPPRGGYLKTHDFLQPLERVGENETTKARNKSGMVGASNPPASMQSHLPNATETYNISYFNQRTLDPEEGLTTAHTSRATRNDENSHYSSYPGSVFTLWDESAVKKGQTGKENIASERHVLREAGVTAVRRQWASLLDKPSQSSSNHIRNDAVFSPFSSSQPSSSQKNQTFMEMITSTKNDQDEEDDDEDEFIIKKETLSQIKGNLSVKVEAKTIDQKPNTLRSKHSATEQRRRSKINDRFQKLREVIPNSDQRRDKASFLLEVIEYIQFLQEKVNRYESPYSVWSHEQPARMIPLRNCLTTEGFIDQPRGTKTESENDSSFVLAAKCNDNKAGVVAPNVPINGQNLMNSNASTATTFKERCQQTEVTTKPASAPTDRTTQPHTFSFGRTTNINPGSPRQRVVSTTSQFQQKRSYTSPPDFTRVSDMTNDTISISNTYSQGLLNTLTKALQSSGVDLSQASISVQIDVGKRDNAIPQSLTSATKENDIPAANSGDDLRHTLKRRKSS